MSYTLVRALIKNSGLLRTSTHINSKHLDPLVFKCSKNMATTEDSSHSSSQKGLIIHGIRALNQDESRYIKPMRFHFTLNGKERTWDCLKVHDSVACVIYNKSRDKLIYVKQFRPAVYLAQSTQAPTDLSGFDPTKLKTPTKKNPGYTIELCAGLIDKEGKKPEEVMQEEISEETGYEVPLDSIKFISSFRGSVGSSGTLMNLYFCEVDDSMRRAKGGGVDDEAIEVVEMTVDEVKKSIYVSDDELPFSRPPAMLFGTSWFLYEYLNQK